jgi:hypothetical protein
MQLPIARNIQFTNTSAALTAFFLGVSLLYLFWCPRLWLYTGFCALLLLVHPAWTMKGWHSDCGDFMAGTAAAITILTLLVVAMQFYHATCARAPAAPTLAAAPD